MKRFLLYFFVFILIIPVYSESKGFSRWSFTPEYGYNKFDGDINEDLTEVIPTSFMEITYGATVEYSITPVWGMALDYYYYPLRAKNNAPSLQMSTNLYVSDLNATANLTRLIFPETKSKFYLNMSLGLGYAFYFFDVTPSTMGYAKKYANAISIPFTTSLEYNISRRFALGVKVHYRGFNKDNLEGAPTLNEKGVTNDFIGAGTLFLRYKFNSKRKDHLRNIKMNVFSPEEGLVLARSNEEKINKLNTALYKLDTLLRKLDTTLKRLDEKYDYQDKRIDSLHMILSNNGPDSDGDGVPDVRDLEPNTPPNTPVDFWGRTLKILPIVTSKSSEYIDAIPSVYFDYDRFDLNDNALIAIRKIAAIMKSTQGIYVEVRGYSDNTGNDQYNSLLSQRRSDRVKQELVNVWKIPSDHIISNGKGTVIEPRSKYRPNRRCDFIFSKR